MSAREVPAAGADLLRPLAACDHIAYLTNDFERAVALLGSDDRPFARRDVSLTVVGGPDELVGRECLLRVALSRGPSGSVELIETGAGLDGIFPPAADQPELLRFHHVGARTDDVTTSQSSASAAGWPWVRFEAGPVQIVFVDARESVGHWLESLCSL